MDNNLRARSRLVVASVVCLVVFLPLEITIYLSTYTPDLIIDSFFHLYSLPFIHNFIREVGSIFGYFGTLPFASLCSHVLVQSFGSHDNCVRCCARWVGDSGSLKVLIQ